jgi:hypothetical protein
MNEQRIFSEYIELTERDRFQTRYSDTRTARPSRIASPLPFNTSTYISRRQQPRLLSIETAWLDQKVDVLPLEQTKHYRSCVHEVVYDGRPAVSKIAAFDYLIPSMERETWGYRILDRYQRRHPGESPIAPRVLGHLTECGRVIGILLERPEGDLASVEGLPECAKALRRLYRIGLVHGGVNGFNFVFDRRGRKVKTVDFEHVAALDVDEAAAGLELESFALELTKETGRGGSVALLRAA